MKEQILKLRKEGKSYNEIHEILGCAISTISYHCLNYQDSNLKMIEGIKDEYVKEVIDLRLNNLTYLEIWNKIGGKVDKEKIRIICNKNNLSFLNHVNELQIEEIKKLYEEVGNYKKVANNLGLAHQTVRRYIEIKNLTEEQRKKVKTKSVVDWRVRTKQKLVDYKGGECIECGYNKCLAAMEFHHLDPNEKDFTISGKSWAFERLKKEVDKCILVCNRCHTEIHFK